MSAHRSSLALSTAALLWGFLQAPFFHIHPGEDLDHPAAAPVHMHIRLAPSATDPVLATLTSDDDAIDVDWVMARPSGALFAFAPGLPVATISPVPAQVSAAIPIPQRRSHDPPDLVPKQPRAPPA